MNISSDEDNIIVSWQDGIVKFLIDEKLRTKSKSVGIQHVMDILGESSSSENKISQYSSIREGASGKMFMAKLLPKIKPGNILGASQPPPQSWNNSSTSECNSPTKTSACNNWNDQQSVEMKLPSGCTDLKFVSVTSSFDDTGPMWSEQIKQCCSLPILKTRTKTNVWPTNAAMLKIIKHIIGSESPCPNKPEFCFKMTV